MKAPERPQPVSPAQALAAPSSGPVLPDPIPSSGGQANAFDLAISLHALHQAADDYASRHGLPGSAAYRTAWLSFRQRVHSLEDLDRMRAKPAHTPPKP